MKFLRLQMNLLWKYICNLKCRNSNLKIQSFLFINLCVLKALTYRVRCHMNFGVLLAHRYRFHLTSRRWLFWSPGRHPKFATILWTVSPQNPQTFSLMVRFNSNKYGLLDNSKKAAIYLWQQQIFCTRYAFVTWTGKNPPGSGPTEG